MPFSDQLQVYPAWRVATRNGHAAHFTAGEFRVFLILFENRKALNRHSLLERIYAFDPNGGPESADKSVATLLHRVRRKLVPLGFTVKKYALVQTVSTRDDFRMAQGA